MSQLIIHPQSAELRNRLEGLREELALLLSERIRITFEELPAIRYRYTELFGELERLVERRTLEMSERKRLVELFALKLDRGQKLDAKMIDLTMRAVYKEFERIRNRVIREAGREQRKAEGSGWWIPDIRVTDDGPTQPQRRREELRDLYRRLAKLLHPDTRKNQAEEKGNRLAETWWDLVQRSYERGDLHALQTMINIVENRDGKGIGRAPYRSPEEEEKSLTKALVIERERLRGLKEEEPYSLKDSLLDEEWIAGKRATLKAELESIEAETAKCDKFLAPILAGQGEHVEPETVQDLWSNFIEDVYLSGRY